jgi:hypothetical protein
MAIASIDQLLIVGISAGSGAEVQRIAVGSRVCLKGRYVVRRRRTKELEKSKGSCT